MLRRLLALAWTARALDHRTEWAPAARTNTPKNVTVFYNIFAGGHKRGAEKIVLEQLHQITNSSLWTNINEIRYATVGNEAVDGFVQKLCRKRGLPCIRLGHADVGSELNTLQPLHDHCRENNRDYVAYVHDKGSFHKTPANVNLRRALLRALSSQGCYDAVTSKTPLGEPCDVCSLRFSPLPHQHVSGNMWLARCSYVKRLIAPAKFPTAMAKFKRNAFGACRIFGPLFGTERYAFEHWVHSHPRVSPCDASTSTKFQFGYNRLPPKHENLSVAPAPRFAVSQLRKAALTGTGIDARLRRCPDHKRRTALDSHVDEWLSLYGEVPPAQSRVMKFYRSLLPRRPGANATLCAAIYGDVAAARGSCRLGAKQWCSIAQPRKCEDRADCVACYDRLGATPGGVKSINMTDAHLERKQNRRDKRHRREGRPVTPRGGMSSKRFNMMRGPPCRARPQGCTEVELETWAGVS